MQPSPLKLETYFFEEIAFRYDPKFASNTAEGISIIQSPLPVNKIINSLESGIDKESSRHRYYRLKLEFSPGQGEFPYSFTAVIVGFFYIEPECSDEAVDRVADANAPAVLYGVAREAIATITGRGPLPPLCLPSVHFLDVQMETDVIKNDSAKSLTGAKTSVAEPKQTRAKPAKPRSNKLSEK